MLYTRLCNPTSHTYGADDVSLNKVAKGYQAQTNEKFSLETNSPKQSMLPPSDQHHTRPADVEKSCATQPGVSWIFAGGFGKIVDAKMEEPRIRDLVCVVGSLLTDGVRTVQSAPLVSMVAQTMLIKLMTESPTQIKSFEGTLRLRAMEMFCNGDWRNICSSSGRHSALMLIGVNKAGLLGSLFSANIVTAKDIAICLTVLLEDIQFDRLCAIHALLYADDRLRKKRNLPALIELKEKLRAVDPLTNLSLWGTVPHSQALIQDVFDTIKGWMVVRARKREQHIFTGSYFTWTLPSRAIGPRLRGMRNKA
ncbi:uncharacterized protein EDB93DRAFT_1245121 [Suillus bovinus]|uniref:uncharacterized protein n=1 Tax=Suillus bovinus TaxID=48563 RepID=UPI001B883932|nr:uncharacterized protein EDB93DRAFT_1245121 [Suillus bovinus]KAG2159314.1 hypothetical protein EDB93DRAFT_1245121 [Suillus bovinus]